MQECALCASSVYDVHHASVCVNVVIGVLVVLCELHVIVRFHVIPLVVHAAVGLTRSLIAHVVVVVVFVVAILHRIFCIWRYTLYTLHKSTSSANVAEHVPKYHSSKRVARHRFRSFLLVQFINTPLQSQLQLS